MVYALAVQADGKILVGGAFSIMNGQARSNLGRLNPDGSLDITFNPGTDNDVYALAVQEDGKILVGGFFATLDGQPRDGIARLNPDGSLDISFNPGADGTINALALQSDGKILVGGSFDVLGGQPRKNLARLNADGSLDAAFNPGASSEQGIYGVSALAVQPDGKILVGGLFTTLASQPRSNIGRLNANGSLDTTFNPGADYQVSVLAIQPDGKVVVGGAFNSLGGQPRGYLGRLNANGSLDLNFNPEADGSVETLALLLDGKILVGGAFDHLRGYTRHSIGRLQSTGSLDLTFDEDASGGVSALAVQADGSILLGGSFNTLGGQPHEHIGRLSSDTPALQSLTPDPQGSTITWLRSGSGPQVERVSFEQSNDDINYSLIGSGTRVTGGWQLAGLNLPIYQTVYIRARGYYQTGEGNASASVVEMVQTIYREDTQAGPVFTVNTAAEHDDGQCGIADCTLREAINAANTHVNGTLPDEIRFNITTGCNETTGVCTIAPTAALPHIKDAVVIDGYTQPGASPNTLADGNNARLLIELNGANIPSTTTDGLYFESGSNIVRGLVINRFSSYGIYLSYSNSGNTIAGNFIGTDPAGKVTLANSRGGVFIYSNNNMIGGTNPSARNLISGNRMDGLNIRGSSNQVLGNYIGTDATGTVSLGNAFYGINVEYSSNNIIGGCAPGARNLISGNGSVGLYIHGSTNQSNIVQGNFIGTDVTGTATLGNRSAGIWIDGGDNNTIGGPIPLARNLISGNSTGIAVSNSAEGNIVQGNFIGTNVSATANLGNVNDGISIGNAPNNTIGGTTALAGNVIGGNGRDGLSISNAPGITVQGNFIGTDWSGSADLGNAAHGVNIDGANIPIGGTVAGAGNVISNNGLDGVHIYFYDGSATGNTIQGNSIHGNAGLGIGINEEGVTHNDAGDSDTGSNNLQNFPLLTSLRSDVLGGTLNSTPSSTFRVEFFANTACDPSGYGEGEQFLGAQEVTTNSSGSAAFSFPYTAISGKPYLTATATNTSTGDTSEFSPCLPYATTTTTFYVSPAGTSIYGSSVTLTAVITTSIFDNPIPTGQVQFKNGDANLGAPQTLNAQGVATITTSALPAGTLILTAQFLPNDAFPGSSSSLIYTVTPKTLTVTGINALDKVYDGTTSASLDLSGVALAGIVGGDDIHLDTASAQAVFADKDVGDLKTVTISGLTLTGTSAGNYTLTPPALTASITPRLLTLSAENKHKVYGEAVPTLTVAYSGFAPGETPTVLTHAPELSTTATQASPPGIYLITITPGSPAALNYIFAIEDGELTVEKASTLLQISISPLLPRVNEPVTFAAVVEAEPPGAGIASGTVTFDCGDGISQTVPLSPNNNGNAGATFTTDSLTAGSHTLIVTYSGDGNFATSTGQTTFVVEPTADLAITLQASQNPAPAGSPLTLTFTATNQGTAPAESTVMNIDLPAGLNFLSATSSAGTTCTQIRSIYTCDLGDLAPSASHTVTVKLSIPRNASGIYTVGGSLSSPSINPPGGGYPAVALILTVEPRTFHFLPILVR